MKHVIPFSLPVVLLAFCVGNGAEQQPSQMAPDLDAPRIQMRPEGAMGRRLDAIVENWLIPAPAANPGMIEMMRLRDRKPAYEDPVPWAGEFVGKFLTSCVLACRMSDNAQLRETTEQVMRELIATQAEDGYLGPFPDKHLLDRWDLWGHYHCMLALYLWYRDSGDAKALQAATRAADLMCNTFLDTGKRVHDAGSHEMNMAVLHILGLLYRETQKPAYLRLLREVEQDWQRPPAGDYHRLAASGLEFYQTPKPRWESLHPMIGLAELYRITGEPSYRDALVHWWGSIYRTDIHNSGSFSANEQAVGNPFQPGAIETCCTVAWIALSVEALRLTGDSRIADALEHATWNAVLGYEHPSGRWCTYDTPMNGKRLASAHSIVFQSRPGTPELNCCSVNGPNGLGMMTHWAVLGGRGGLYLNYYGPGTIEVQLEDDSKLKFVQTTGYPVADTVQIEVRPSRETTLALYLRIPEWSKETKVLVNGDPVGNVMAGRYLELKRTWAPGDRVTLQFDFRLRLLRGDHHVQFNTSLLRGPILLTFDQKYNTMDPDDVPQLDLNTLTLEPLPPTEMISKQRPLDPIVAFAAKATGGQRVVLCDFASAGAHGTFYRSWLPVQNAPIAPFRLEHPEAKAVLPLEEVYLTWSRAEPGATHALLIATDPEFRTPILQRSDLSAPGFRWVAPAHSGITYHWQVEVQHNGRRASAMNGPLSFTLDANVPTSLRGVVLKADLAGTPEPDEGQLLVSTDLTPAAGRDGQSSGAIGFNGKSSRLVYDAPQFPLRTYTFAAWLRPEGLGADGRRWHQIGSAWSAPMNDPLRVSVQDQELVVSIEQPSGGYRLSGGRVENGRWMHLAVVKNFAELALYVNGKRVGKTSVPACFQVGPKSVGIGCNPNYSDPEAFQGALANVLFVREALPEEEIDKIKRTLRGILLRYNMRSQTYIGAGQVDTGSGGRTVK